ncbi:pyridoxal phosphate-dependent transferase [Crepidotus variabilis]|uniref:alanine--glyoxylate transaminase n=1 Tax=Crepidotus variabilis TaxID=179855 RepID=A0A9P6E5W1_9AGAR|nr:pyridoxal phosphate-dependent transferase [Crepidotus variabilis]
MTSSTDFKQEPHNIPGPIEVADEVLYANAHPSMSHVSPDFIPVFGDCIRLMREVLFTKDAQPFLISGSGTLGWDQVAANLVEPGENALVLHSGYFGDSFADCLSTYGAAAEQLKAPIGGTVPLDQLASALKSKSYKVVTFTHVDTSTGVLSDAKAIAETVRSVSPNTLVVMDAVCSVASEEIRFDDWDLDVVLTASQKGLGAPPGLSILLASQRAMGVWKERAAKGVKEGSYYASWGKWLPIMKAYEEGRAAYFATPPVNLIYAFKASLDLITGKASSNLPSLEERFKLHRQASQRIKSAATALGLKQLPLKPAEAANGMTAIYFPPNVTAADLLPRLVKKGVVIAGGLHVDIKDKYFRIGHMGISVVEQSRQDVDTVIRSLGESLQEIKEAKGITA